MTIAATKNRKQLQTSDYRQAVNQALSKEMISVSRSKGHTKRTSARLAIANAIRSGVLKPGDFLPSEQELTAVLGVSLGTVQAALRQLQDLGVIVRRRGDGTRVTATEPFSESVWHFRFLSRHDRTPLRLVDEDLRIETTTTSGVWSEHLGHSDLYLRIWRRLKMRDGTVAGAEMYLLHSAASALMSVGHDELRMANIRPYLEENLGIAARSATHLVSTVKLDRATADEFGLPPMEEHFEIHAKVHSPNWQPVYFQRIYVASSKCILEFG